MGLPHGPEGVHDPAVTPDAVPERARSRALPDHDRYRPPSAVERVQVVLDGVPHPGEVLGRNGPRVHVVFELDGARYRRWVDAAAVLPTADL